MRITPAKNTMMTKKRLPLMMSDLNNILIDSNNLWGFRYLNVSQHTKKLLDAVVNDRSRNFSVLLKKIPSKTLCPNVVYFAESTFIKLFINTSIFDLIVP